MKRRVHETFGLAAFRQYLPNLSLLKSLGLAPVAKLDKAPVYETGDYRFESCRARHILLRLTAPKLVKELHDYSIKLLLKQSSSFFAKQRSL